MVRGRDEGGRKGGGMGKRRSGEMKGKGNERKGEMKGREVWEKMRVK